MGELTRVGQIIMDRIQDGLNSEGTENKFRYSERLWNERERRIQDSESIEDQTEAEKKYWERVHAPEVSAIDRQNQRFIFDEIYRNALHVGTEITEEEYFQITRSDSELIDLLNKIIDWYWKNAEFKKGGFFIYSPPGVGKTSIVRALYHMSMIYEKKWNRGKIELHDLNRLIGQHRMGNYIDFGFYNDQHIIIDDLSERLNNISVHFEKGGKYDMNELIENRYNVWKNIGKHTIITTNIYPYKSNSLNVTSLMSDRALDRLYEQYEIVVLTGDSKRRKN